MIFSSYICNSEPMSMTFRWSALCAYRKSFRWNLVLPFIAAAATVYYVDRNTRLVKRLHHRATTNY